MVLAALGGRASADPACKATVGKDQQIFVAGKPTGITATLEPDKDKGSVVTYPYDASHILLAWASPGHYGRPDGSELFVVDCKTAKSKTFWKGDFGHSRMLPDGKTLVFGDGDGRGIGLLDLTTKKAKGLTYPPAFKPDSAECDGREPGLHDIISDLDVDNDLLLFERGGSCGFEGDWDATLYAIEQITTKPSKPRRGYPVAVIAAGGNDVWAAKFACDRGATASAWSSTDLGATWTKHAVPKAASGIMAMFVDPKQPGHVSVVTGACKDGPMGASMPVADRVHVTKDAGTTWQLAKLPAAGDADVMMVPDVESTDGSYDHLTMWGAGDEMWTSSDAGATWKQAKAKPRKTAPTTVEVAGAKLSTSSDGIIVKPAKGPTKRVYPYRSN